MTLDASTGHREHPIRVERIVLALLVIVPLGLNVLVTMLRIQPAWPLTPWEPALQAEGWRLAHGLSVYDPTADGHATHMYGPLLTVWLAALQSVFGFNYPVIRLSFVLLGVATSLGLAVLMSPTIRSWRFLLAATLFLSCNVQTGLGFSHGWADMPALLFAVGGLVSPAFLDRINWLGARARLLRAVFDRISV